MNSTLRALNGFGLGARVGERQRIGDPRGWLRGQLKGNAPSCALQPKVLRTPSATRFARFAHRTAAQSRSGSRPGSRRGARSSALRQPRAVPR